MKKQIRSAGILSLAVLTIWSACTTLIARFDPVAYERTISLKVETLALIAQAEEPFDQHAGTVAALQKELEKAYEAAKGRPKNEYTTRQWEILKDPNGNLVGGFLRHWQTSGSLSPVMVTESQKLIAEAFDQIIGLEGGKLKTGR
jgi:hypothetical protein